MLPNDIEPPKRTSQRVKTIRRRNNKKLKISYFTFWVRCPRIPLLPAKLGKFGGVTEPTVVKGGPYSELVDPPTIVPGKNFTAAQKANIYKANIERNGGLLKSDLDGQPLIMPQKSMSGVTPPSNEAQIDHITPKNPASPTTAQGSNSYSNAQVLSRLQNLLKSNK